jgi:predicted nucleotidyltransferase
MEAELSEILRRKVDLNTPNFLSRYFRDQVMAEAEATRRSGTEVQYVSS